jgi:hypothetical protein
MGIPDVVLPQNLYNTYMLGNLAARRVLKSTQDASISAPSHSVHSVQVATQQCRVVLHPAARQAPNPAFFKFPDTCVGELHTRQR